MATRMNRVVVEWQGTGVVGRSVTVLHFLDPTNAVPDVAAIRSAFGTQTALYPNSLTIQVPGSGDKIDADTGNLMGTWSTGTPSPIVGTAGPIYAAGVGGVITWNTGTIVPGTKGPRRLRGRTFIVPLGNANYDSNGTPIVGAITAMDALATQLRAVSGFCIWHRPLTPGGSDGVAGSVTGHTIRDKVAILTSRRD